MARSNLKSGLRNQYRSRQCFRQSFSRQASAEASSLPEINPPWRSGDDRLRERAHRLS